LETANDWYKQGEKILLIDEVHNSIAADGIEIGNGNKVPIWLLGFLY
jgi:hypothetical protein